MFVRNETLALSRRINRDDARKFLFLHFTRKCAPGSHLVTLTRWQYVRQPLWTVRQRSFSSNTIATGYHRWSIVAGGIWFSRSRNIVRTVAERRATGSHRLPTASYRQLCQAISHRRRYIP